MPLYEYICEDCSSRFEKLVRMSDDPKVIRCPSCASGKVERALSMFATGGGGGQRDVAGPSCGPVG